MNLLLMSLMGVKIMEIKPDNFVAWIVVAFIIGVAFGIIFIELCPNLIVIDPKVLDSICEREFGEGYFHDDLNFTTNDINCKKDIEDEYKTILFGDSFINGSNKEYYNVSGFCDGNETKCYIVNVTACDQHTKGREELKKFTEVKIKDNLKRIIG